MNGEQAGNVEYGEMQGMLASGWADGHTRQGCYWRRLSSGVFGFDCREAPDECVCEAELEAARDSQKETA